MSDDTMKRKPLMESDRAALACLYVTDRRGLPPALSPEALSRLASLGVAAPARGAWRVTQKGTDELHAHAAASGAAEISAARAAWEVPDGVTMGFLADLSWLSEHAELGNLAAAISARRRQLEAGDVMDDDRFADDLGRAVRAVWVSWALTQPDVAEHPSWTVPWEDLSERDRDADRQIGRALYCLGQLDAHDSESRR